MSQFLSFATTASRYRLSDLNSIVPESRVPLFLDPLGFIVNRSRTEVSGLRVVLQSFLTLIPLASKSPQPQLNTYYNYLSSISGVLSETITQQDSQVSPTLHCIGYITDAFQRLMQAVPDLPLLIKETPPDIVTSKIPVISGIFTSVLQNFDQISETLPQIETAVLQRTTAPAPAQLPYAHHITVIIVLVERLILYLTFVSQSDSIFGTAHQTTVAQLVSSVGQLSTSLFSQAAARSSAILSLTATFLAENTLLQSIAALDSLITDRQLFADLSQSAISAIAVVNSLDAYGWVVHVENSLKLLPAVFTKQSEPKQLIKTLNVLLSFFVDRAKADEAKDREAFAIGIRTVFEHFPTDNQTVALTAYAAIRGILFASPDAGTAERLLLALSGALNEVLKEPFQTAKSIAQEIIAFLANSAAAWPDQAVAEMNYYVSKLAGIGDLDLTDPEYVAKLDLAANIIAQLGQEVTKFAAAAKDRSKGGEVSKLAGKIEGITNPFLRVAFDILWSVALIGYGRAQVAAVTFGYLSASNVSLPDPIGPESAKMLDLFSNSSSIQFLNIGSTVEVVKGLLAILDRSAEFLQRNQKAPSGILQIAFSVFPVFLTDLPPIVRQIPFILTFPTGTRFVLKAAALLNEAASGLDNAVKMSNNQPSLLSSLILEPCSMLRTVADSIRALGSFGAPLTNIAQSLSSALDAAQTLCLSALTTPTGPDSQTIWTAFLQTAKTLRKTVNEASAITGKLPRPALKFGAADEPQLVVADGAPGATAPQLQGYAAKLTELFRGRTESEARSFLRAWIDASSKPNEFNPEITVNAFVEATGDYLKSRIGTPAQLLERLAVFSVAIGVHRFEPPWDQSVDTTHLELFGLIQGSLGGAKFDTFLRRAIGIASWLAAVKRYLAMEGETRKMALLAILTKLLPALHGLRLFGTEARVINVIDALVALKDLSVWLAVQGQGGELADAIDPTFESLVNGNASAQVLSAAIAKFAERATSLRPCNIFLIPQLQNNPVLLTLTYGRAALFRESSEKVLEYLKSGIGSVFDFSVSLSAMASLSCEVSCLVFESLALSGLSAVLGQYIKTVADQLSSVSSFVMTSLKPPSSDTIIALRKQNLKMLNNFEDLVNLVESPVPPQVDNSEFGVAKLEFEINLAELTHQIGRLIWTVTNSYVPEMYDTDRMPIYGAMEAAVRAMKVAAGKALPQSTGSCRNDFAAAMIALENSIQQWILQSINIDFCEPFAAASLIATVGTSLDLVLKVHKISQALVVSLTLTADRKAASLLPLLEIPVLGETTPSFGKVFGEFSQSDKDFRAAFEVFSRAFGDPNSQTLTLLDSFEGLVKAGRPLVLNGFQLCKASIDSKLKVVLQDSLRSFVHGFTLLHGAVRARLLRLPQFEAGFSQTFAAFQTTYQPVVSAAEAIVRGDAPVLRETLDKHLRAVQSGLSDISGRFKTIVAKVNTATVQKDDSSIVAHIDVEGAKKALLPCVAFHAPPVIDGVIALLPRIVELTTSETQAAVYIGLSDLSDAVGMLCVCTEGLVGKMNEPEVKVLAAARAVYQSAAALVQLVNGMNDQALGKGINVVADHAGKIVARAVGIFEYEQRGKKKKTRAVNRLMEKSRLESEIESVAGEIAFEEEKLAVFNHRF